LTDLPACFSVPAIFNGPAVGGGLTALIPVPTRPLSGTFHKDSTAMKTHWLLIVLGLMLVPGPLRGDVLELTTGQRVEGEVLKETPDALFLDLGVDVIRIPLERIRSREAATRPEAKTGTDESVAPDNRLYLTRELRPKSVKELAAEYGEGVVLVQTPGGLGSGFIINSRGFCVTNYHVIERETQIAVTIYHKTPAGDINRVRIGDVRIVALNPFFDLALLQIPLQKDFKFQAVYLNEDDDIKEGDPVFAIGNPLGLERSVSEGIVSTRNRNFQGLVYIQTTAQINPGNSGGPLFNTKGEVVGVTNMKLILGEGLGFAIPVAYVRHFLKNRDAFAFDKDNPNSGFRYLTPPRKRANSEPEKADSE
jgi:serine protease Do